MTEPIKPTDIIARKPDQVIEVFNELILKNWDGVQATVKQSEAAKKIAERMGITISDVFEKKHLNIEEVFRQSGWSVVYDKPDYNETPYDPFFCFSQR